MDDETGDAIRALRVGDRFMIDHPPATGIRTTAAYARAYPTLHRVLHWFGYCLGPPLPKGPATYKVIATTDDL